MLAPLVNSKTRPLTTVHVASVTTKASMRATATRRPLTCSDDCGRGQRRRNADDGIEMILEHELGGGDAR